MMKRKPKSGFHLLFLSLRDSAMGFHSLLRADAFFFLPPSPDVKMAFLVVCAI